MKISLEEIIFVINPNSGKGSSKILKSLLKVSENLNYFISNNLEEFDTNFRTINTYKVVVICGGDGTINNTLKYLAKNRNLTLAILPNGSGNGFARELGFKMNINTLIRQLVEGKTEKVDLMKVNNDYSCNVIGLGFDSYVATEFEKKSTRGLKTYVYCIVKALFNFEPIEVELDINNETIKGIYQMVTIANTRQFGNNAIIAPYAKYNDNLLDVVLIKPIPLYLVPFFVLKMFTGKLANSKYVHFIKTEQLNIKSNSTSYHLDGEPKKLLQPLHIRIDQQFQVTKTT